MIPADRRQAVTGAPDAATRGLSGAAGAGRKRPPVREQRAVLRPYLHELDRYMARYLSLSTSEKTKRRRSGLANFTSTRYADDFAVLCNGTKVQAEAMREELYTFLKTRLELSKEKTKITHVFLGFWLQRSRGGKGTMSTKMVIPAEAMKQIKTTLDHILAHPSHQDSGNAKMQAINRRLGGWCRYYQYTGKAATQFSELEHVLFWKMAHGLGRKFNMRMSEVMRRFHKTGSFATTEDYLIKPTEYKSLQYRERFFKPNPYLTLEKELSREALLDETYWTGDEQRPGMADLRPQILERDRYTCQHCGTAVTTTTGEVDHIKPVRRFKRPIDANVPETLWTLCLPCHAAKTPQDRQAESRMRG
jgi:hypothetical protein